MMAEDGQLFREQRLAALERYCAQWGVDNEAASAWHSIVIEPIVESLAGEKYREHGGVRYLIEMAALRGYVQGRDDASRDARLDALRKS